MNSLWPLDLLAGAEPEPLKTLREQAEALSDITLGRLSGQIDQFMIESVLVMSFLIMPNDPDNRYELFRVRTVNGTFPCVIEAHHLEPRLSRADNKSDLDRVLSEIFGSDRTKEIVKVLVEANSHRTPSVHAALYGEPVTLDDGRKVFGITLGSVHTYIDEQELLRIISADDEALFAPLGSDQYVVTLTNSAPIRSIVSLADIVSLQNQAKVFLSSSRQPHPTSFLNQP